MAYLDTTTGANFIPELWSEPIYKFFFRKLKLRNSVDDYSAMVKDAGDTIHIPKIQMDGVESKTASSALSFSIAGTEGKVDLDINNWKYLANVFEDMAVIQSNSELMGKYTKMYGEALARKVETDLWAELDGFQTRVDVPANNTFTVATLETVLANLYSFDIDPNDCSMALSNLLLADILDPSAGVAQYFIRQDAVGDGSGLRTGAVGLIYGMDVFHTAAAPTATTNDLAIGAVYPSNACVIAMQQDIRVQAQYDVAYLGTKVVADMIYGMKLVDESGDLRGMNLVNLG